MKEVLISKRSKKQSDTIQDLASSERKRKNKSTSIYPLKKSLSGTFAISTSEYKEGKKMSHLNTFSKPLSLFTPVDVKMLVDLSSVDPLIKEYADEDYDCDILKGEICQIMATPTNLHLGKFNSSCSGTSYYDATNLKENIHFIFV